MPEKVFRSLRRWGTCEENEGHEYNITPKQSSNTLNQPFLHSCCDEVVGDGEKVEAAGNREGRWEGGMLRIS